MGQNPCDPTESFKEPEGGCAEFSCSEDSDCDDGNPDTIDTCVSGSCQNVCGSDAACDDGDACTADTCVNGVCSSVLDCSICGGGATSVLELTTDNYPAETSWDIKNSSGDEQYEGSGYSEANTLHTINMCLASDEYTFKINDAYGDGICCSYGNGGYKITVDGTEVVSGGTFGNSETKTFTVTASPTSPVSPPTSPVSPPTPGPTTSPVSPPTGTSPTPYPTEAPPTPYPTQTPPTPHPTHAPPTSQPTPASGNLPPTPYPTDKAPTPYPPGKAPTPWPTHTPPTPHPTGL